MGLWIFVFFTENLRQYAYECLSQQSAHFHIMLSIKCYTIKTDLVTGLTSLYWSFEAFVPFQMTNEVFRGNRPFTVRLYYVKL